VEVSGAIVILAKHVSDLNLQECAIWLGLPQAPSKFLNNSEALKQKRDFVFAPDV
jgi:membrane peptidoglycan carboxypeptidase